MTKREKAGWAWLSGLALVAMLAGCGGGSGGGAGGRGGGDPVSSSEVDGGLAQPSSAQGPSTPGSSTPEPAGDVSLKAPMLGSCELFPADAVFNTRIDDAARFPPHKDSSDWIASIGGATRMRADWWRSEDQSRRDAYYGMPFNLVDGSSATTDWASLSYDFNASGVSSDVGWPHESDCAVDSGGAYDIVRGCSAVSTSSRRFPFPSVEPKLEGGTCNDPNTCGDRHLLVVEQGACRLWEGFSTYQLAGRWYALATAAWDLKSLALRPANWTAADAAGLPITPFLAKAAEASTGEIRHALRVTLRDAVLARSFTWPARHAAGGDTPGGIPFGALLRLRADFAVPDHWTPQARAIATAAKRYGLYVADIGEDFYVQGEPSVGWDEDTFRQVGAITLAQMEFVDLGAVTRDARFSLESMAARWR